MCAWTRLGIAWALGLLFAAHSVAAELPAPRKVFTNKQLFHVPIRMGSADRAAIQSLKFYVKPPGGAWTLQETGNSSTTKFDFKAEVDGEYQFNFITVDTQGNQSPADPDQEPPKLIVVVDRQPPEFIVKPLTVASGPTYLQCMIRDANPDMASLLTEYETEAGTWKPLVALGTDMPGIYRCVDGRIPSRVRVSGKDKSGNSATQIIASAAITAAPVVAAAPANVPLPAPVAAPMAAPAVQEVPPPMPVIPALPVPVMEKPAEPRVVEKPASTLPVPVSVSRQLVNTARCNLAYGFDSLGGQSVIRVEAYSTRDEGKTWLKLAEDPDRLSPIELTLPEDGLYGIALVVTTLAHPANPPMPGEQPDWWLEVDTTAPEVKLESATLGTGDDAGLLLMNWMVRDRNLAPDAVEVSWSHQPDGPWQSIAKGLRAEGQYRWPIAREAGSRVYLKVESIDRAGNVGRYMTPQPITIETARPRAKVLGINPAAVRP